MAESVESADAPAPVAPGRSYRGRGAADDGAAVSFDKGRDRGEAGEVLRAWLEHRTGASHVEVRDLATPEGAGISNETILFVAEIDDGTGPVTQELVLRVSPDPDKRLCNNTHFETQARLLQTLGAAELARVPAVPWYEEDPRWFDRPFFVMRRAHGRVPISEPVYNSAGWLFEATPAQRRVVWETAVDEMIRIHQVPVDLVRFLPGGGGAGPAFDQVLDDLQAEYAWACAGVEHPVVDRLWGWLDANRPPAPPDGLSWGDARIGNMMFDDDFRLVVVLDWELVTLGGSILDLGWWLFFDDVHRAAHPRLDGLGDRDETIERWAAGTGLDAEHLAWYEVLAAVRLATIVIRGMTIFGIAPNDQNLFVQLAYRRLGWGDPA